LAAHALLTAIVISVALAELPRDLAFLSEGGDWRLRAGMLCKIGSAFLVGLCLPRRLPAGWAFLFVWCVQGLLMSYGEFQGGALHPLGWLAVALRLFLLASFVWFRVLGKESSSS
jgi:hypothetical protein